VAGKRLFDADGTCLHVQIADARVTGDGSVIATYDRQRAQRRDATMSDAALLRSRCEGSTPTR
jgi:hypothetical protein